MIAMLLLPALFLQPLTTVSANPVAPLITPPARLRRQQGLEAPYFVGYFWSTTGSESSLRTYSCDSTKVFTTTTIFDSTYAGCCEETLDSQGSSSLDCSGAIATACSSGDIAHYADSSRTCETACKTHTIYASSTKDGLGIEYIGCRSLEEGIGLFRERPKEARATTTTTSTLTLSSLSVLPFPSSSPSNTPEATTSSLPALPPPEPLQSTRRSKAWLAGVILGPVLGFIAVAGLIFLLLRMRSKKRAETYQDIQQTARTEQPIQESSIGPRSSLLPPTTYQDDSTASTSPSIYSHGQQNQTQNAPTNSWYQRILTSGHSHMMTTDLPELVVPRSRK